MAGIQWSGGKIKGSAEVKANFRHNDKSERMRREHSNPDINLAETQNNFSYHGLSYFQKCKRYDERLAELEQGRQSSGKNARVTLQSLVIYAPKDLPQEKIKDWFQEVGKILDDRYGRDFIEMDVHMDEIHDYIDPSTGEVVTSRVHGHAALIPEIDGKLNAKRFCSRKNINELNKIVDDMTTAIYGIPYILGKGSKSNKTVAELKRESEKVKREMELIAQAQEAALSENERLKKENGELVLINKELRKEHKTMKEQIINMKDVVLMERILGETYKIISIPRGIGQKPKKVKKTGIDIFNEARARRNKRESGADTEFNRLLGIELNEDAFDEEYEL